MGIRPGFLVFEEWDKLCEPNWLARRVEALELARIST